MTPRSSQLRLGFFGNLLGNNPGYVTTQGQIVAGLFASEGYEVICSSSKLNRFYRLFDIVRTLIVNRKGIDVCILEVYSGLYMVLADTVSRLCRLFGIRLIAVLHGGSLPEFTDRFPRWTSRVLAQADMLVAPSSFLAEKVGRGKLDIRVVPNVLELDTYSFRPRKNVSPKLIWMRSFHPIYNPHMALDVMTRLHESIPDVSLVMAGVDKGMEPEIRSKAAEMKLNVRFPGFLSDEAKAKEFSDADIYINTNRIDNMPVSVLEACAMGLPVVATNVGGIPHLLTNEQTALLVTDGNADEMADAIKRLLADASLAETLSINGRLLAERSSWPSVRKQWEQLFEEVLAKSKVTADLAAERI